jgi:hypothetical protein
MTGKKASPRPGTTRLPGAFRDTSHAWRRPTDQSLPQGGRLALADERGESPAHGTGTGEQVIERVAGVAPGRVKIHRHTAAGLASITWPSSVSSDPTPHTIESARRARLTSSGRSDSNGDSNSSNQRQAAATGDGA